MEFKVGDKIKYGIYINIEIVGEYKDEFILSDKFGNTKSVYKWLVNRHGKLEHV